MTEEHAILLVESSNQIEVLPVPIVTEQVMVPPDHMLLSSHLLQVMSMLLVEDHITQYPHDISSVDYAVPLLNQPLAMLLQVITWTFVSLKLEDTSVT